MSKVAEWFERERGIRQDTLERFAITVDDQAAGGTAGYQYPNGAMKTRTGILSGERKFFSPAGQQPALYYSRVNGGHAADSVFLCEGETDTMRLQQELWDAGVNGIAVGLPGINAWRSSFRLGDAPVFVILDNDDDYNVQGVVDTSWASIKQDIPRAVRIRLPQGVKDLCEFFMQGFDLDDLRSLATKPSYQLKSLDLTEAHIVKPVNWLVEGLIGQGDICILFGEPGVGKSYLTLSLALGIIQGDAEWLGLPLKKQGRVLYVDEENPEDVVYNRLNKLGFGGEDYKSLRYIHEQGVRLDRGSRSLIEDAIAFEPTLIVLDSLTRLHTENENDAGSIAKIINDGIKPLARQTGATVVVIHHSNKATEGGSYRRMRGSIDIGAGVDAGIETVGLGPGVLGVDQFRSRRQFPHPRIIARITDTDEGKVRVMSTASVPVPY